MSLSFFCWVWQSADKTDITFHKQVLFTNKFHFTNKFYLPCFQRERWEYQDMIVSAWFSIFSFVIFIHHWATVWLEIRIRKVMFSSTRHSKSHQRHKFDVVKKSNNIVIRQKTIIPNIAEVWWQKNSKIHGSVEIEMRNFAVLQRYISKITVLSLCYILIFS